MKLKLLTWAFAAFCLLAFSAHAQPCECLSLTGKAALDSADIVFAGKVTEFTTNWMSGGWKATFSVESVWKGDIGTVVVVNTPLEKDCGFMFKEGFSYVVYANKKYANKTTKCAGNSLLTAADFTTLGPPKTTKVVKNTRFLIISLSVLVLLGIAFLSYVILRNKSRQFKSSHPE